MAGTTTYGRNRSSRKITSVSSTARSLWPEIRISRFADIDVEAEAYGWHSFISKLGRLNYGRANAKSLGSVAVTLVSATEMGKMLIKSIPKIMKPTEKQYACTDNLAEAIMTSLSEKGRLL